MKPVSPARVALHYLGRRKTRLASAALWRGLYVVVPMQVPLLTGAIIDGLSGETVSIYGFSWAAATPREVVAAAAVGLVAVALLYGLSAYGQLVASARLSRSFVLEVRRDLVQNLCVLSTDWHARFGTGDLLERVVSDAANLRRFVERVFVQTVTNVVRVVYPVVMLLLIDARLTLWVLSVLPVQSIVSRYLQRRLHSATQVCLRRRSDLTTVVKETFDGVETLQALHAEREAADRICRTAERLEADEIRSSRLSALVSGNVWLMTSAGMALCWWMGGQRILEGKMTLGTLVVFTGLVAFVYQPFRQLTAIATTYRRGLVSLERIGELLAARSTLSEPVGAPALRVESGRIELRDVEFSYRDGARTTLALCDVSLVIERGGFTAVVGRSGSGKSSLARLILRLRDPDRGAVMIDGQPLDGVRLESVRTQVALVPQQSALFSGTLADNLRLAAPRASEAELWAACRAAGAESFVARLPERLATRVGRGGVSLSGGQVHRLAIARALVARPRVLLLDEPTAALDSQSESALVATLRKLGADHTVVVIAHRAATVAAADRVVVMDDGRIEAEGTDDALRLKSDLYNELFRRDEHPAWRKLAV